MKRQEVAARIFDLLAANPNGVTMPEMCERLDRSPRIVQQGIQALRAILADDDSINVVADPVKRGPWQYRLVGTRVEAKPWGDMAVGGIVGYLRTVSNVYQSISGAKAGRIVRRLDFVIAELSEEL